MLAEAHAAEGNNNDTPGDAKAPGAPGASEGLRD